MHIHSLTLTLVVSCSQALLEVSDQGGGCPVAGFEKEWPDISNIFAGPFGGGGLALLSHYARFTEIAAERQFQLNDTIQNGPTGRAMPFNWSDVYHFRSNPRLADLPVGTAAYNLSHSFASTYTSLLRQLHRVFNGEPQSFGRTMHTMYSLSDMATSLMTTQDPRESRVMGMGPVWEYVD